MNTKVLYLPSFVGVYHTRTIKTYLNANACMVHMVHTLVITMSNKGLFFIYCKFLLLLSLAFNVQFFN